MTPDKPHGDSHGRVWLVDFVLLFLKSSARCDQIPTSSLVITFHRRKSSNNSDTGRFCFICCYQKRQTRRFHALGLQPERQRDSQWNAVGLRTYRCASVRANPIARGTAMGSGGSMTVKGVGVPTKGKIVGAMTLDAGDDGSHWKSSYGRRCRDRRTKPKWGNGQDCQVGFPYLNHFYFCIIFGRPAGPLKKRKGPIVVVSKLRSSQSRDNRLETIKFGSRRGVKAKLVFKL